MEAPRREGAILMVLVLEEDVFVCPGDGDVVGDLAWLVGELLLVLVWCVTAHLARERCERSVQSVVILNEARTAGCRAESDGAGREHGLLQGGKRPTMERLTKEACEMDKMDKTGKMALIMS